MKIILSAKKKLAQGGRQAPVLCLSMALAWDSITRLQTEHSTPNMTHAHTPISRPTTSSEGEASGEIGSSDTHFY